MILNMKVHPSNKNIKNQFTYIQENIEKSKFSYGIESDIPVTVEKSPLWCSLLSLQSKIQIKTFPLYSNRYDRDSITIRSGLDTYTLYQYQEDEEDKPTVYWTYSYNGSTPNFNDTLNSIASAINTISGLKTYVIDFYILVAGIDNYSGGISSNTPRLNINTKVRIVISKGSLVFGNGNKITLDSDINLSLYVQSEEVDTNKIFRIVARYSLQEESYGVNEVDQQEVKTYGIVDVEKLFAIEENSKDEPDEDTICLGILKFTKKKEVIIDSNKESFKFNRPRYSVMDINHESFVGTSKVTHNNPHGIGYNDIDETYSLHSNLTQFGLVLSVPTEIQDLAGNVVTRTIYDKEVKVDFDGIITSLVDSVITIGNIPRGNIPIRYFVLPEIPNSIMSITDLNEHPVELYWIKNTCYLVVPYEQNAVSITVTYVRVKTLAPSVSNRGEGVLLNDIEGDDIIISEGKNVTSFSKAVTFTDVQDIDNKYDVYINKEGNIVKIPSTQTVSSLSSSSGNLNGITSRSRLEVFLTNIPSSVELECPTKKIKVSKHTPTLECSIYQVYALYDYSGNIITESYTDTFGIHLPQTKQKPNEGEDEADTPSMISVSNIVGSSQSFIYKDTYEISYLGKIKNNLVEQSLIGGSSFLIQKRTGKKVYGGVRVQIILGNITSDSKPNVILAKGNVRANIIGTSSYFYVNNSIIKAPSFGIDVIIYDFEGLDHDGNWNLIVTDSNEDKVSVDYVNIQWSFGVIKSNLYAKVKDFEGNYTTRKLNSIPISGSQESVSYYNIEAGTESTINTNEDFSVIVSISGVSDNKSISEKLYFDSSFRNQKGLNSLLTNNVFDSVSKYSIEESSTTGKITILGYPVGTIGNLCGIFSARYEDNKIVDIIDRRSIRTSITQKESTTIYEVPQALSTLKGLL